MSTIEISLVLLCFGSEESLQTPLLPLVSSLRWKRNFSLVTLTNNQVQKIQMFGKHNIAVKLLQGYNDTKTLKAERPYNLELVILISSIF